MSYRWDRGGWGGRLGCRRVKSGLGVRYVLHGVMNESWCIGVDGGVRVNPGGDVARTLAGGTGERGDGRCVLTPRPGPSTPPVPAQPADETIDSCPNHQAGR